MTSLSAVVVTLVVLCGGLAAAQKICTKTNANSVGKPTVVLSMPGPTNTYYADRHTTLLDFYAHFACQILGNDNVVVFCAASDCAKLVTRGLPSSVVIPEELRDIWMRDFSPAGKMAKQVAFVYKPNYLTAALAKSNQDSLFLVLEDPDITQGLGGTFSYLESNLIVDGGNIVDNNVDTAILTRRVVTENTWAGGEEDVRALLKTQLGYDRIIFVDEVPNDTTGHSDGMLSFIDTYKLAIQYDNQALRTDINSQLQQGSSLPNIDIVDIDEYYQDQTWDGFSSACNVHVNSIVTKDFIYMPHFGIAGDADVKGKFEAAVGNAKTVVPVNVPTEVCQMGGSVRCLAWQTDGSNANLLIDLPDVYATF